MLPNPSLRLATGALRRLFGAALIASACAAAPLRADDKPAADPKPAAPAAGDKPAEEEKPAAPVKPDEKPAAAKPKDKAQPNIIQNVLRGIFGGAGGGGAPAPGPKRLPGGDSLPGADPAAAKDRLDARAASDVELNRRVGQLRTLVRSARWDDAMDLIEFLLEAKEDRLIRIPNGSWVSLLGEVEQIVLTMPEEGRRSYQNRFEGPASTARIAARDAGDFPGLVKVASRFFPAPAGQLAGNDIASVLEDNGDYGSAAHWSRRLLAAKAPITEQPAWRVSAARKLALSGDRTGAEQLLKEIPDVAPFLQAAAQTGEAAQVTPKDWLDTLTREIPSRKLLASETRMPYGEPSHAGGFRANAPLLFPKWKHSLVRRYAVEEQLDTLLWDLVENKKAALPALFPVAAAGKVAVRTLFGVAVYDAESGTESWRMESDVAPERLLAGEPIRRTQGRVMVQGFVSPAYDGNNPEQHPLASVIFRDGVYGSLSSDGKRLFVLEDIAVMPQNIYGYWQQEDVVDPLGRDWKSNSLVAYDLQTGRRLWRIGGRSIEEVFAPTLAGAFFFGAPVPDGDELFVIGERGDAMHLYCLSAATGEPLWTQQISGVGQTISRDMVRRSWPCWPAVGEGLIVCPTTAGWLVAVDRVQHRFQWTYRYMAKTNTQNMRGGYFVNQSLDLHARWYPNAPILSGGTVLFAPPELPDETGVQQPMLVALDARTGKPRWTPQPKSESLVVAAADEGRAYLTGIHAMKCIQVKDGSLAWEARWPDQEDRPSGRGLLTETAFLQPMRSGAMLEIDRATGKITRTQKLRQGDDPPGNVIAADGRVFSVSPQEIVSWEPDQPLADFEKEAQQDRGAALRLAELYLRLQRPTDAIATARSVSPEGLAGDLQRKRRDVLWEGLWQVASADLKQNSDAPRELEQLVASNADRLALLRLKADRAVAQGALDDAWNSYLQLIEIAHAGLITDGQLSVRHEPWLAGRLGDTYSKLSEASRGTADETIRKRLDAATTPEQLQRSVLIFGFHPAAQGTRLKLADEFRKAGKLTEAAVAYRQLRDADETPLAATASIRLAALYAEGGWVDDARAEYERGIERLRETGAPEPGTPVAELVAQAEQGIAALPASAAQPIPTWSGAFEVVRVFREHSQQSRASTPYGERPAFLRDKLLQVNSQTQRLSLLSMDNESLWSVPLRSSPAEMYSQESPILLEGPLAYVVHNGVIHSFSLFQQKPLWTHIPDLRGGGRTFYRQPQMIQAQAMLKASAFLQPRMLSRVSYAMGMLGGASDHVVVVYDKRSIRGLDPLSGQLLWERRVNKPNVMAYLDGSRLYLYAANDPPALIDAYSGQIRKQFQPGNALEKVKRVVEGGLIECELTSAEPAAKDAKGETKPESEKRPVADDEKSEDKKDDGKKEEPKANPRKFRIAKVSHPDLATGKTREFWKREFAIDAWAAPLGEDEFLVIEPDGRSQVLNLHTGRMQELANLKEPFSANDFVKRRNGPVYCVADRERVYVLIDQKTNFPNTYLQVPNIRCSGVCVALSRSEPKILWQEDVTGMTLLTERIGDLPVLPFLSIQNVNKADIHYQDLKIRVLDKSSGKPLVNWEGKSYSSHIHAVVFDFPRRSLEFRSYNETFQVRPVAELAGVTPAPTAAPELKSPPPTEASPKEPPKVAPPPPPEKAP